MFSWQNSFEETFRVVSALLLLLWDGISPMEERCLTTKSISKPTLSLWFLLSESWSLPPHAWNASRISHSRLNTHNFTSQIIHFHHQITSIINQNSSWDNLFTAESGRNYRATSEQSTLLVSLFIYILNCLCCWVSTISPEYVFIFLKLHLGTEKFA